MNTPIRIVIKGLGTVGKQFTTEALKRGVQVVGAVDGWDRLHGTDLGSHLGVDELGVRIEADVAAVLRRTEPDVLVLANATSVADIAPDLRAAVEHGVDVITSAEHAFFWERVEPEVGRQLDAEAVAAGVTLLGTGIQDVFWAVLPAALTAASHSIDSIAGFSLGLMDPYGPVVMDEARIGWTVEDFHGDITTTSGMINRLGDVIAAQPGFITVNDLPVPSFQNKALDHSTGPAPASTPLSNPVQEAS